MAEVELRESRTLKRFGSIDVDGFEFEESTGYGSRAKTRTVKVTRAALVFEWDFKHEHWVANAALFGHWILKDGSLGKDEHRAYSRNDARLVDLRMQLIEQHIPRTVITLMESVA